MEDRIFSTLAAASRRDHNAHQRIVVLAHAIVYWLAAVGLATFAIGLWWIAKAVR